MACRSCPNRPQSVNLLPEEHSAWKLSANFYLSCKFKLWWQGNLASVVTQNRFIRIFGDTRRQDDGSVDCD
jgi:hypothetical protein